jgi:hypothetical protein
VIEQFQQRTGVVLAPGSMEQAPKYISKHQHSLWQAVDTAFVVTVFIIRCFYTFSISKEHLTDYLTSFHFVVWPFGISPHSKLY